MYQVAVIGGGPGGYVAGIRLQQYGINAVVFEKERLGGVCLNRGCIPTKSLVKVAELYREMQEAADFGLSADNPTVHYHKVWQRKNAVVEQLVSGIEFMYKKRNIPLIAETVTAIEKTETGYRVTGTATSVECRQVIIATGSVPKALPFMPFDGEKILSSKHILDMQELPKHLVVIGGGVIGCEFASIYSAMGVQVEIVEFLPTLVSTEDTEIAKRLTMALKRSGIKIHTKTAVESFTDNGDTITLHLSTGKEIETQKVLVSVGRGPQCDVQCSGFSLAMERGCIVIDHEMRTSEPGIFAIGDVTGKMMLAHTASKQALIVADILANELKATAHEITPLNYMDIPRCTFTHPEIGSVGLTEEQAKKQYEHVAVGKFPFTANGKALGSGYTFGFVKAIVDEATKRIIGMHIIGPNATELIAQGGILVNTQATLDDVKKVIFAHPTLSEAVMEALEDAENLAVHKI
jgi:dihydrolipoamide dehydrogenase